jgi:hypothetical protein
MYFFDPMGGNRRRALVRDRLVHAGHLVGDAAQATGRDVRNRTSGLVARTRRTRAKEPVDDHVLVERVRAQLGRVVSHPRAIEVDAEDGVVTLRGPVLQSEVVRLCDAVARVGGVWEVVDALDTHESAENIPSLQGGIEVPRVRRRWSPTTQLMTALAATAGVGLVARTAATRH